MKKLYFLNEAEKERILRLHNQKKYEKSFLNEQSIEDSGIIENPTEGIFIPKPGEWKASAQGDFKRLLASYSPGKSNRTKWVNSVTEWCRKNIYNQELGPNDIKTQDLIAIVERVGEAMAQGARWLRFGARGVTSDTVDIFKNELLSLKNIPSFCHATRYKTTVHASGGENLMHLFDEIWDSNLFVTAIVGSLQILAENTKLAKKGTGDTDWEKAQLEFYKTFPCLTDIARATRAKNAVIVQNPSEHEQIRDKSQGTRTTITDQTTFLLDGTYQTGTDRNRGEFSGKFNCDSSGEYVMLYPGKVGMGEAGGIFDKFPCLAQNSKISGNKYTTLDPSDNNTAIMEDDLRLEHSVLSGYPTGQIFFFSDGTFQTESDDLAEKEVSGRFKCNKRKTTILASPYASAGTQPDPIKKQGGGSGGGSMPIAGMGIVLNSVKGEIPEVLNCANIAGSTLTQDTLNKLYEFIKNNK